MAARKNLDEFFDTYQLLFAHRLATVHWQDFKQDKALNFVNPLKMLDDLDVPEGKVDDDALSFAVFDSHGRMIFNDGDRGRFFVFEDDRLGFLDHTLPGGKKWRMVWIKSPDEKIVVAVGQKLKYRNEAAFDLVSSLLTPWLLGFLALSISVVWLVTRELKPIRKITTSLTARAADDLTPLPTEPLPQEIKPMVVALNSVFERLRKILAAERALTANAAHELRTPLTAIKVQAEVALLAADDPMILHSALDKVIKSIDQTAYLFQQLLTLARLDNTTYSDALEPLQWPLLIKQALESAESPLPLNVNLTYSSPPALSNGYPALIGLLLRNLLDNAQRYSPEGADISINVSSQTLTVSNSGITAPPQFMDKLGQRFFRPPGQKQDGSGLGLSIVQRVAEIHGLKVIYKHDQDMQTFSASLLFPSSSNTKPSSKK